MDVAISSGHGLYVRGASGYIDEVDSARNVVAAVAQWLRKMGCGAVTFNDDTSETQDENLKTIVNWHNKQVRDLDVSVHFNAYEETEKPMGTEVLWVTNEELAEKVSAAIATVGFIDRGPKFRDDLYFLNNTECPAILIETCFVDSRADTDLYNEHFQTICKKIAGAIAGVDGLFSSYEIPPSDV